jgi:hypothetical protein
MVESALSVGEFRRKSRNDVGIPYRFMSWLMDDVEKKFETRNL